MNFLAHLFLSGNDEELIVGNFIGDFVKGKNFSDYPPTVRNGIILHRAIDTFTDQHETVTSSKVRLRPRYRHYSPVIVDVFYDHFLASQWTAYHHWDLYRFSQWIYEILRKQQHVMPTHAKILFSYMARDNWLYHYREISGIERALTGMSRRTPYTSYMKHSVEALQRDYPVFREEFNAFFPELIQYVKMKKSSL